MSYADAVLFYAMSYLESYVSYVQHLMRHKTLHKITIWKKSYVALCASYALLPKVLCDLMIPYARVPLDNFLFSTMYIYIYISE